MDTDIEQFEEADKKRIEADEQTDFSKIDDDAQIQVMVMDQAEYDQDESSSATDSE